MLNLAIRGAIALILCTACAGAQAEEARVANTGSGTITVVATIPVGQRPCNLALTRDGANGRNDNVPVIDTISNKVARTVAVGKVPWGVAIR